MFGQLKKFVMAPGVSGDESGIAAVIAHTRGLVRASSTMVSPKESEKVLTFAPSFLPVLGSNLPIPWNLAGSSSAKR